MSAVDLIGRLRGYVIIRADGYFTERFLNICMRRGIFLWDVKKMGDERICASISISDFKAIRQIAAKTRTRVRIIKRCGLPFFVHRYRKRKTVFLGILIFLFIIGYLSSHVVGIDVMGNERIAKEEVISGLREFGVYPGVKISRLDRRLIQNQMMTKLDDIAWIGVNIKGSKVYIEIKERLNTKIPINKDEPCNIIAKKDGVLRRLEVKEGQTVVKINDMVEKGDLLVSGAMDSEVSGIRYVHSFGEIYAGTTYKKTQEYPLEYTEKIYDGKEKSKYSIEIMGKKIKFFIKDRSPYENYEKTTTRKEYNIGFLSLPSIYINCDKYASYIPEKRKRSVEQAVVIGKEELCRELESEIPVDAERKNVNVTYIPFENKVAVTVEYECEENIAEQTAIDKIENMNYDIERKENNAED